MQQTDSKASWFYGFGLIWVGISQSILFLVEALFKGVNREMSDRHVIKFASRLLEVSHTKLEVEHLERIDPHRSYVYMSNHQSILDIPVALKAAPQSVRMVAKQGLFKIPFFGSAMAGAGFIPIDRKNIRKAKEQLGQAQSQLKAGMSIWVFPEGTRSRSLELLPLKKGGFHVALALGVPIVPVFIEGAAKALPSDTLKVLPNQTIRVVLGHPIETAGLKREELPFLMQQVREALEKNE
ncbi:MAG: lysophospholipid acyltransferase family protein [Myxococcaceae bacterium]